MPSTASSRTIEFTTNPTYGRGYYDEQGQFWSQPQANVGTPTLIPGVMGNPTVFSNVATSATPGDLGRGTPAEVPGGLRPPTGLVLPPIISNAITANQGGAGSVAPTPVPPSFAATIPNYGTVDIAGNLIGAGPGAAAVGAGPPVGGNGTVPPVGGNGTAVPSAPTYPVNFDAQGEFRLDANGNKIYKPGEGYQWTGFSWVPPGATLYGQAGPVQAGVTTPTQLPPMPPSGQIGGGTVIPQANAIRDATGAVTGVGLPPSTTIQPFGVSTAPPPARTEPPVQGPKSPWLGVPGVDDKGNIIDETAYTDWYRRTYPPGGTAGAGASGNILEGAGPPPEGTTGTPVGGRVPIPGFSGGQVTDQALYNEWYNSSYLPNQTEFDRQFSNPIAQRVLNGNSTPADMSIMINDLMDIGVDVRDEFRMFEQQGHPFSPEDQAKWVGDAWLFENMGDPERYNTNKPETLGTEVSPGIFVDENGFIIEGGARKPAVTDNETPDDLASNPAIVIDLLDRGELDKSDPRVDSTITKLTKRLEVGAATMSTEEINQITQAVQGLRSLGLSDFFQGQFAPLYGAASDLFDTLTQNYLTQQYNLPGAPEPQYYGSEEVYQGGQPAAQDMDWLLKDVLAKTQIPQANLGTVGVESLLQPDRYDIQNPYMLQLEDEFGQAQQDLESTLAARGIGNSTIADQARADLLKQKEIAKASAEMQFLQGIGGERRADTSTAASILDQLYSQQTTGFSASLQLADALQSAITTGETMDLNRRMAEMQRMGATAEDLQQAFNNALQLLQVQEQIPAQRMQLTEQPLSMLLSALSGTNVSPNVLTGLQTQSQPGWSEYAGSALGGLVSNIPNMFKIAI